MGTVEIAEVGICDLLEVIYPRFWDMEFQDRPSYEEQCDAVVKWCKENNFYFYEMPKEVYFEWEAYDLAKKAGCVGVVLSNLS